MNGNEHIKSALELYVEYKIQEAISHLPSEKFLRLCLFYYLVIFNVFLTWMVTNIKPLPDLIILLFIIFFAGLNFDKDIVGETYE
jgi:hypothetical protein